MRNPAFCICENKDADQLRGNREADQRHCFRYIDSTTGTRSMIAVCYGYRIKLYRINIIRDMVMQLNFTYLPKTGQHSKNMVASQTSWL